MTQTTLERTRHALGLSTYELALVLRLAPAVAESWCRDGIPIPQAAWVEPFYAIAALLRETGAADELPARVRAPTAAFRMTS